MSMHTQFDVLTREVHACRLCPRMSESVRVLNYGCGAIDAPVMFVGEAPGRLGADQSALPFHGDRSGHNFEELLAVAGLTRYAAFVTNAVLCNPRDAKGNNAAPSRSEIGNCSGHLRRQIEIVNPRIVVTLGATALRATAELECHELCLSEHVRTVHAWFGRKLIPLYHPGQRAMLHRSMANQRSDYRFVSDCLRSRPAIRRGIAGTEASAVVRWLVAATNGLSYFALHKLFYLSEYEHARRFGRRITSSYIVRQKDGPYCVELHPAKLKEANVRFVGTGRDLRVVPQSDLFGSQSNHGLGEDVEEVMSLVVRKYGALPNDRLKTVVYMTSPMRRLLRLERAGRNLFNAPIVLQGESELTRPLPRSTVTSAVLP